MGVSFRVGGGAETDTNVEMQVHAHVDAFLARRNSVYHVVRVSLLGHARSLSTVDESEQQADRGACVSWLAPSASDGVCFQLWPRVFDGGTRTLLLLLFFVRGLRGLLGFFVFRQTNVCKRRSSVCLASGIPQILRKWYGYFLSLSALEVVVVHCVAGCESRLSHEQCVPVRVPCRI